MKQITPAEFAAMLLDAMAPNDFKNSKESLFTPNEVAETTEECPVVNSEHYDDEGYMLDTHPDYNGPTHITKMIEQVTVLTLSAEGKLDGDTASTLEKLSRVHAYYNGIYRAK